MNESQQSEITITVNPDYKKKGGQILQDLQSRREQFKIKK